MDVIAFGHGSIIQFTTLSTGNDSYYRPDCKQNGDGVSCLAGHKNLMLFAFGELVAKPKIFVLHYPSFRQISVLQSNNNNCFSFSWIIKIHCLI